MHTYKLLFVMVWYLYNDIPSQLLESSRRAGMLQNSKCYISLAGDLYILYTRTPSGLKSKLHMPHLCPKISFRCKLPEVIIFRNQKRYSIVGTSWLQAASTCSPLHFPPHPLELQLQTAKAKLYGQKYLLTAFFQTTTKSGFLDLFFPGRFLSPDVWVLFVFVLFPQSMRKNSSLSKVLWTSVCITALGHFSI